MEKKEPLQEFLHPFNRAWLEAASRASSGTTGSVIAFDESHCNSSAKGIQNATNCQGTQESGAHYRAFCRPCQSPVEPMQRLESSWEVPKSCEAELEILPEGAQLLRTTPLRSNGGLLVLNHTAVGVF